MQTLETFHAVSNASTTQFDELRASLQSYISPMMVETVLKSGLRRMGETEETLAPEDLEEYVSHVMVSLRLFVAADRLPELMVDLALLLERRRAS